MAINQLLLSGKGTDRLYLPQGSWLGLSLQDLFACKPREGTMRAEDVTGILNLARQASGCDPVYVVHRRGLLSPSREVMDRELCLRRAGSRGAGQNRTVALNLKELHPAGELRPAR